MSDYTVADLVAEFLQQIGATTAFGIVSVHNIPMLDAISGRNYTRVVPTRGEAGGGHMADGYARAAAALGVLITSTGPGARRGDQHAQRRGRPGVTVGHVPASGLSPGRDHARVVAPRDRIQHRDVVDRDDAEGGGRPDLLQELGDEIGDGVVGHGRTSLILRPLFRRAAPASNDGVICRRRETG